MAIVSIKGLKVHLSVMMSAFCTQVYRETLFLRSHSYLTGLPAEVVSLS